jgi:ferredoxin
VVVFWRQAISPGKAAMKKEAVVRVEVDRDRCEGNAVCLGLAPDIFDLDDEDYAVVKTDPIPADQEDLAEQAIAECPRAALLRKD